MKTQAQLYAQHQGNRAASEGLVGVICGYNDYYLIMAVDEPSDKNCGWGYIGGSDFIDSTFPDNELGYLYVFDYEIVK